MCSVVETQVPTNEMTTIHLGSYADTEFVRWVDWASVFAEMLNRAHLEEWQVDIVRKTFDSQVVAG